MTKEEEEPTTAKSIWFFCKSELRFDGEIDFPIIFMAETSYATRRLTQALEQHENEEEYPYQERT